MQDQYTGLAGTYIIDAEKGIRVPLEQYEAEQAAKAGAVNKPTARPSQPPLEDIS